MTTTFEAGVSIPDTHSSERTGIYDIEARRSGYRGEILSSGLSQRPTVDATGPDILQQFAATFLKQNFGLIDRSQPRNRMYLVRSLGQCPHLAQPTPMPLFIKQQAKHEEHRQYLQRVSTEGKPPLIARVTAKKSWDLWLALRIAAGPRLPIPSAGTGPGGVMFYSWDKGDHHLEAEIFSNRDTEFFYRNRRTGELWGEDYTGGALPTDLLDKLSLFV